MILCIPQLKAESVNGKHRVLNASITHAYFRLDQNQEYSCCLSIFLFRFMFSLEISPFEWSPIPELCSAPSDPQGPGVRCRHCGCALLCCQRGWLGGWRIREAGGVTKRGLVRMRWGEVGAETKKLRAQGFCFPAPTVHILTWTPFCCPSFSMQGFVNKIVYKSWVIHYPQTLPLTAQSWGRHKSPYGLYTEDLLCAAFNSRAAN